MKSFFTLLVFIILILTSCDRCKEDKPNGCECQAGCNEQATLDDMYSYFLFKEGSYWVYEEENSGTLDTLTLYHLSTGEDPESGPWFRTRLISSNDDYTMEYNFTNGWSIPCQTANRCTCHKVNRLKYRPGDNVGGQREILFPPIVGDWNWLSNYSTGISEYSTVETIHEQYEIGNLSFPETIEYQVDVMTADEGQKGALFMSKNVGLVRKELHDDEQTWNLIAYNVIPK